MPGRSTEGRHKSSLSRTAAQEANAQPPEPNSDSVNLTSMVESMIKSSKKRRNARRTKLKKDYNSRKAETQEDINSTFASHKEKSHQIRKAHLERLIALLKRKDDVEARMVTSVKALERAYLARSAELRAAIDGRIAELR
ncbi:hypothetical protein B0J12DRAFT_781800 [Macrophomina phaseolina]|nr:hypothetical protein B0J12DRAFT_781800 [Macrophomina phaseolina]